MKLVLCVLYILFSVAAVGIYHINAIAVAITFLIVLVTTICLIGGQR
jgi:hypothetical protein